MHELDSWRCSSERENTEYGKLSMGTMPNSYISQDSFQNGGWGEGGGEKALLFKRMRSFVASNGKLARGARNWFLGSNVHKKGYMELVSIKSSLAMWTAFSLKNYASRGTSRLKH